MSSLLLIEGKPGSGKSTLTKYFNDNLEREPAAIVVKYFYSSREGELQASHRSMLRSILYDILDRKESFFYSGFQTEYRKALQERRSVDWPYQSLKTVLLSLGDHPLKERLYLIIDALDEADREDTRDILDLLFSLCSKTTHCTVKVFIASRPDGVLKRCASNFVNVIKLQDHTLSDIRAFTRCFIKELEFGESLQKATEYIVQHAKGVFIWVELVGRQLKKYDNQGRPLGDIFTFLRSLPLELKDMYELMLKTMPKEEAVIQDGIKMFRFVLFAGRPLRVSELIHTLRVPDDPFSEFTPSDTFLAKTISAERYVTYCGGNFLECHGHKGTTKAAGLFKLLD